MAREPVRVHPKHAALPPVDFQPDFMPGGALAVGEGDLLIEPLQRLMNAGPFTLQVAMQDRRPPDHVSFASRHPGYKPLDVIDLYGHEQLLWPDHCIQGRAGAELYPHMPWQRVKAISRKGTDADADSYIGFRNNWNRVGESRPTGLGGYLRERDVSEVFLCGLARDYCVQWTAEDAAATGFVVRFIWDLTRLVDSASDARLRAESAQHGIGVLTAEQLCVP
ncbi:MAG: nicotinamidase [Gammaproteobacteria bacterium]